MNGTTKAERRDARIFDEFAEVTKVLMHFFPGLAEKLNSMDDPRRGSCDYTQAVLIMMVIMKNVCSIVSMRQMNEAFNEKSAIINLGFLAGCSLEEMPDWQTANNYLMQLDGSQLQSILTDMISTLIRCKTFNLYRFENKYWRVIIDGTGYAYFKERHCEHDLVVKRKDPETGKERLYFYHKVLEAKIILAPDVVISLGTEFIENESADVSKQDCEQRAAQRLLARIKGNHPRLPIVILADSLYATMPFMELCRKSGWHYIINLKSGSQKNLYEDFSLLLEKGIEGEDYVKVMKAAKENGTAYYVNNVHLITGKPEVCNILKYEYLYKEEEDGKIVEKTKKFVWVSDIELTVKNVSSFIRTARSRWDIEESFRRQKKGNFRIEHLCSKDPNGMKIHYILTQFADLIMQLAQAFSKIIAFCGQSISGLAAKIKGHFTLKSLTEEAIEYIQAKSALHYYGAIE